MRGEKMFDEWTNEMLAAEIIYHAAEILGVSID